MAAVTSQQPLIVGMIRIREDDSFSEKALGSASDLADAFAVLDNGPRDRGAAIYKTHPKVKAYQWHPGEERDELQNKNLLFKLALDLNPEWILALEGNEELEPGGAEFILHAINTAESNTGLFSFDFYYLWNDGDHYRCDEPYLQFMRRARMFRVKSQDLPSLSFEGLSDRAGFHFGFLPQGLKGELVFLPAKIKHYGFLLPEQRKTAYNFLCQQDHSGSRQNDYRHLMEEDVSLLPLQDRSSALRSAAPDLSPYYSFARPEILALVPQTACRILELGCASGRLGKSLKARRPCHLAGMELNPLAAREALKYFDEVLVGDTEAQSPPFPDNFFDCIICADVLEHLKDPWEIVRRLSGLLRPGGVMVCSIPNIRNLGIMRSLAAGEWKYEDAGILDRTHLRFFTRRTFAQLLLDQGLEIDQTLLVKDQQFAPAKFASQAKNMDITLGRLVIKNVSPREFEEFTTVQFLFVAHKALTAKEARPGRAEKTSCLAAGPGGAPGQIPAVSLIMPVHNRVEYTKQCCEALVQNTPSELFNLVIINNASTDLTGEFLKCLEGDVRIIHNEINSGFIKACNQGSEASENGYLLFLHNDTIPQPGWLEAMLSLIKSDDSIGAVGAKLVYPDGRLQAAGGDISPDGACANFGNSDDPNKELYRRIREADYCPAACLLVRQDVFNKLQGFDTRLEPDGYAGADLCLKIKTLGYKVLYCPDAVVAHYADTPLTSGASSGKNSASRELFFAAWKHVLKTPSSPAENTFLCSGRPAGGNQQKPSSSAQLVSIIILTHNQLEYTQKCLQSLFRHVQQPFELIMVDNHSTDGTKACLEKERSRTASEKSGYCKDIQIIANSENLGFAAGNNQGLAAARGGYVLLMNNDIVVTPGWLDKLTACAEQKQQIGIVGPMSNYVSGPQLVSPADYNILTLDGLDLFSENFSRQYAGRSRSFWRMVGFCLLVKRAVIEKIGGLDPLFGLGNFEDDDFALRACLAGFESWLAQDCFIHHFGSRTFAGAQIDYQQSLQSNWKIFKQKWNLPAEAPYGAAISLAEIIKQGFRPEHYCPLNRAPACPGKIL